MKKRENESHEWLRAVPWHAKQAAFAIAVALFTLAVSNQTSIAPSSDPCDSPDTSGVMIIPSGQSAVDLMAFSETEPDALCLFNPLSGWMRHVPQAQQPQQMQQIPQQEAPMPSTSTEDGV